MKRKWIQNVRKRMERKRTKGALEKFFYRKLGIPIKGKIPLYLLEKVKNTPNGKIIVLNYGGRKARIRVTPLLKKRVTLAITLRKIRGD